MLMEIVGALHSALATSVDENAYKWKTLRWDLKEIYGTAFFTMPDFTPFTPHNFGVTNTMWDAWELSACIMSSTIKGIVKILVMTQVIERIGAP